MKASRFIIERLKQLAEKFTGIKIRYEFRVSAQSHLTGNNSEREQ